MIEKIQISSDTLLHLFRYIDGLEEEIQDYKEDFESLERAYKTLINENGQLEKKIKEE
jgi:hypothetical protein